MRDAIKLFKAIRRHEAAAKKAKVANRNFIFALQDAKFAKSELDILLKERELGTSTVRDVPATTGA